MDGPDVWMAFPGGTLGSAHRTRQSSVLTAASVSLEGQ